MLVLSKIKKNIEFNHQFKAILEVLKSIAVSQFHSLERKLEVSEPFDRLLEGFCEGIDTEKIVHPFLKPVEEAACAVAVTSDQGLLGGLNMKVVGAAMGLVTAGRDQLVIVGEQGKICAHASKIPFVAFPGIHDEERFQQAMALRDYLFQKIQAGQFCQLKVVYARALSLVNHRVEVVTLLPLPWQHSPSSQLDDSQIIFESAPANILEYLAFLWVGKKLCEIFGLSRLAELGARFVHLEECTQRIEELNKKLQLQYFRLRHEVIDQSMRELFAARILYANAAE